MENIREETAPLQQPERRRVAQAYSESTTTNILKKNAFWIFAFFTVLLLSSGGGDDKNSKRAKKLRKQAEVAPAIEVQKQYAINREAELEDKVAKLVGSDQDDYVPEDYGNAEDYRNGANSDDDEEAEEELEEEIENAMFDVDAVEEEEIDRNDSMLVAAVRTMEDNAKFYLGRVFGFGDDRDDDDDFEDSSETSADVKLSEDQLDLIAKKISERLEADVKKEFRAKADAISEEKVEEIEQVIEEDRDADMNAREIADDVAEVESVVLVDLKDEIEDAAEKMKDSLPDKAKRIRDEVVEEVTGKKLEHIEEMKRKKREKKKLILQKVKELNEKRNEEANKQSAVEDTGMKRVYDGDNEAPIKKTKSMPIDSVDIKEESAKTVEREVYESKDEDE